jgi:CheY-like chemotaxis protein
MNEKLILLIEDGFSDIALTRRALDKGSTDYQIVVVEDGAEALDYFACRGRFSNKSPHILPRLILLDLKLPKYDGLHVLKKLKEAEHTKLLPVVVLTSSSEIEDIKAAIDLGANSYVRKPVDYKAFTETINNLVSYWLQINEPPPYSPAAR